MKLEVKGEEVAGFADGIRCDEDGNISVEHGDKAKRKGNVIFVEEKEKAKHKAKDAKKKRALRVLRALRDESGAPVDHRTQQQPDGRRGARRKFGAGE